MSVDTWGGRSSSGMTDVSAWFFLKNIVTVSYVGLWHCNFLAALCAICSKTLFRLQSHSAWSELLSWFSWRIIGQLCCYITYFRGSCKIFKANKILFAAWFMVLFMMRIMFCISHGVVYPSEYYHSVLCGKNCNFSISRKWNCRTSEWVKCTALGRTHQSKALINLSFALFRDPENDYAMEHILQRTK